MNKIWYLSPSNQGNNVGVDGYGSERDQMYLLIHEITPHLDRAGVSFHVPEKTMQIAQRVKESNEMEACFHFALHSNAGGKGKAWGPVALYYSDTGKVFSQNLVASLLALGQKNNRSYNIKQQKDLYELRNTKAPAALLEVDFHDSSVGVEFITKRRAEIAEAIAKVIIEADGKEFVPETSGDHLELAAKWGLFDTDRTGSYRWQEPLTRQDAAILAVRLKKLLERG